MNTSFTLRLLGFLLVLTFSTVLFGQEEMPETDEPTTVEKGDKPARPKDMLEFGLRPQYMWVAGDVTPEAGYGGSIYFRKALDYVFSVRLEGTYGDLQGDNGDNAITNRNFATNYLGGTGSFIVSLNNFKLDRSQRNTNIYALVGAGANFFETEYNGLGNGSNDRDALIEREFAPHGAVGAGIAFRLGSRVNLGVEYQGIFAFGKRADRIDGYDNGSNFRDVINSVGLALNFNLGNKTTASEPLYWISPIKSLDEDFNKVNARIDDATNDADGDGIVDAIDQEPNTPANVPVDTRGRTLDSDKDGIPDFRDEEPFFPPRPGEEVDENGVVINRIDEGVTEERVQEMIDASIAKAQLNSTTTVTGGLRELFIPMIYFPLNQYTIKYSDYGTLSSVASVMNGNPELRLVVRGYTDKVGNAATNERLSYLRAKAVIDHLVNQHGVSRSRFVLQYRGQDENIVPLNQTYLNRRVEFHTAEAGDYEQQPPAGVEEGRGGF